MLEKGGESEDSCSFLILTIFEFSVSVIVSIYLAYLRDIKWTFFFKRGFPLPMQN